MKIFLSSLPHLGHVIPMNVLKTALESRGHEVLWDIPAYDLSFSGPLSEHLARFQELSIRYRSILLKKLIKEVPDLIIVDPTIFAIEEIGVKLGIPWALFSNLPLFYPFNAVPLVIQGSIPEFEQEKHVNLIYSGPTLPWNCIEMQKPARFEEIKASQKPIIYVTQGTVATKDGDLIQTCKEVCKKEYFLVDWFMQYTYFMHFADVFVTNGGYGGVQAALWHGVPMVIAGETEDKPIVAIKAEAAGVAINLRTKSPSKKLLKEAIKEVLVDKTMQIRSKELSVSCKKYSLLPALVALEELAFPIRKLASNA